MPDTLRRWVASHIIELLVLTFGLGGGWVALNAQVEKKADKDLVTQMANDIRDIKALICDDHPNDSTCREVRRNR